MSDSKFGFVEHVVYINLDHRTDRRAEIEAELAPYFPPEKITRFSAVQREMGAMGATESHIAVLEMAIREGWKCVLVLEDDAMWGDDFESSYGILETLAAKEYDVVVLGGHNTHWDAGTMKLQWTFGAEGYIVQSHYYSTLLDVFKSSLVALEESNMPWQDGLDVHWNTLVQRDNWFVVRPNLMKQRPGFSDIRKQQIDYHT